MSHWQELIAAAQRVCDIEESGTPEAGVRAAIGRLRTAVATTRRRREDTSLTVFSGVGMESGVPFVELAGPELPITLPAASALELGHSLARAAESADLEAALVAELRAMQLGAETIGGLLAALRRRRSPEFEP